MLFCRHKSNMAVFVANGSMEDLLISLCVRGQTNATFSQPSIFFHFNNSIALRWEAGHWVWTSPVPTCHERSTIPFDCYMIGGKHWDGSWLSFLTVPTSSWGLMMMWTGLSPPPSCCLVSVESLPSFSHTSSSAEAPMGRRRSAGVIFVPVSELSLFSLSAVLLSELTFSAVPWKRRTLRWIQKNSANMSAAMASATRHPNNNKGTWKFQMSRLDPFNLNCTDFIDVKQVFALF